MTPYEETIFWSRQFDEHLQFLQLLFTDGKLKREATLLQNEYARTRRKAIGAGPRAPAIMSQINGKVFDYQSEALKRLEAGEFLGWAFPLFVDHITREMELFAFLVGDGPRPRGRTVEATVKQLGAEHAMFAAHLLDPTERELANEANAAGLQLMELVDDPSADRQAADVERAIGRFVTENKLGKLGGALSIIPRSLADHVVREQVYFANKLS